MSNEPADRPAFSADSRTPTPVPERILQSMQPPDPRPSRLPSSGKPPRPACSHGSSRLFSRPKEPVVIYPASADAGAWVASLTSTLSPGDHALMVETGQFACCAGADGGPLSASRPKSISTGWY